jgi:hypothetical protein
LFSMEKWEFDTEKAVFCGSAENTKKIGSKYLQFSRQRNVFRFLRENSLSQSFCGSFVKILYLKVFTKNFFWSSGNSSFLFRQKIWRLLNNLLEKTKIDFGKNALRKDVRFSPTSRAASLVKILGAWYYKKFKYLRYLSRQRNFLHTDVV